LTFGFLVRFSLPLALTFLMMAGAAPIVSNGITWMHGAEGERVHLSAFLMTFALSICIYSPMFMARNVAIRTVHDRRSMKRYLGFMVSCAAICSIVIGLVSQVDFVGHFVFGTLLQTDATAEVLARQGMLLFVPIPIFIALRGMAQGCHITNGQNWYVGAGTALRLTTMAVFVFGYAIYHDLSGPMLGGWTYMLGIGAETLLVLVTLRNKSQWRTVSNDAVLSYRQFVRYAGPLMAGSLCNQLLGPVLIFLIHIGRQPVENAASFNLLRDTGWLLFSMLMTTQPAVVTHATSPRNLRTIVRFICLFAACISGVTALVALTPLHRVIFIGWLEVDNVIIQRLTFAALLWLIPMPFINVANLCTSALHVRSGRTLWVWAGNALGLVVLFSVARILNIGAYDGVVVAVVGGALFHLTAATVQAVGLLGDGLHAAASPIPLAERLNDQGATFEMADPERTPERVQA
jgi:hypothetical protein